MTQWALAHPWLTFIFLIYLTYTMAWCIHRIARAIEHGVREHCRTCACEEEDV